MPSTAKTPGNNAIKTFIKSVSDKNAASILQYLIIQDEESHDQAVQLAGDLMDEIGDVAAHPVHVFMDLLGAAIEQYENKIYPPPNGTPESIFKYLMEAQGLKQSDFADIFGSQGNVSQILRGTRKLNNLEHIRQVAERLHVSPTVFL